ncbi:MAG: DUF6516 family protein [Chloroflexota bacterium]
MLATDRLLEIVEKFGSLVQCMLPLELDGETLRVVLYLKDGTNIRVTEQWHGSSLRRYSYYWLTSANALKVGWDNAPHHTKLESFPHHKHVGQQENMLPSGEICLEDVMNTILDDAI